jgi:CAAX protease family protein
VWFSVLLACGLGGLLLGAQDLAALTAVAGVFVTAHAADLDPRWRGLHQMLVATLCVVGAGLFAGMGALAHSSDLSPALRAAASIGAGVSAVACLALIVPFVARDLARLLFRVPEPSHVLRLGARLTVMAAMVGVVGSVALRGALDNMLDQGSPLLEEFAAGGSLAGYVIAAFASVGFLIRRDLRETLRRLGLRRPTFSQFVWIALGVVMLAGLNGGFDALEHRFLPSLWQSDQRVGEAIAGGLTPFQMAMVGLSAGIGEEITLRGALQPKLGIVLTSLVFALLHVQYSWFGMLVIFLFGIALGLLRRATSTTVVMSVHTLYDILALMTS